VSIVDCGSEGCYPLPQLLSSMTGVLAVGLAGGQIMLMDLCRINCDEGRPVMHQSTRALCVLCSVFCVICMCSEIVLCRIKVNTLSIAWKCTVTCMLVTMCCTKID